MKKILVVDDEPGISLVLKTFLTRAGFLVKQAYDGRQTMELFQAWKPSLVLLDVILPDMDGRVVLKWIRGRSECPVIIVSALSSIENRLEGLGAGADDYLCKPFHGDELVARVQAVLRRRLPAEQEEMSIFGNLEINFAAEEICLRGRRVDFTPQDLALFLFLASSPNETFEREQLIEYVWDDDYDGSVRAVDLAVKRIRHALSGWPKTEGDLVTVKGSGYQFHVPR